MRKYAFLCAARKPPGFAFVEFEDSRDADVAIGKLDGQPLTFSASLSVQKEECTQRPAQAK